jgi:hypothetical protein
VYRSFFWAINGAQGTGDRASPKLSSRFMQGVAASTPVNPRC